MQRVKHLSTQLQKTIVKFFKVKIFAMDSSKPDSRTPYNKSDMIAGEIWNGRLAMIGFVSAIATEVLLGQPLLPKVF